MSLMELKTEPQAALEHRKALLSLRWLLIILASYLTLFSYLGREDFVFVFATAIAFSLSNVVMSFLPRRIFQLQKVQTVVAAVDLVFVALVLYLLRVSQTYLHLGFTLVFVLAVFWRDLRLVLFSLFVVSLIFGVFRAFSLFRFELEISIEQFLTLSLFFIVSIFYIFLSDRLRLDAQMSAAMLEEKRNAEVMVDITRTLSSSLNSNDVLFAIVSRLCEVLQAEECSILRIDPKAGTAQTLVNSIDPGYQDQEIKLEDAPDLKQAYESRSLIFNPHAKPKGVIVLPMIARESVLGLIYIRSTRLVGELSEASVRFFDVVASTAANALRNAQLFEEVEHRARTDYLTGLPNHRFFQQTLSTELGRAQRHNHSLSLLIIDLDFLKDVNDRFGHPSGDKVIRGIAETIKNTCREIDFAARYGGEEFTVILPETPLTGAIQAANRLRERIAAEEFPGIGTITASIGISNYPVNALGKEDLIRVADQALYVAKNGGRDRVAYFNYQMITK